MNDIKYIFGMLIGSVITAVRCVCDYWQIILDRGTINVYSDIIVECENGHKQTLDDVIGTNIISIEIFDEEMPICVILNDKKRIVLPKAEQSNFPERACIYLEDDIFIVLE